MIRSLSNLHQLLRRHSDMVVNSGWLLADKIIRMGGGLLVGVWVARYLQPSGFGLLNYTIALSSLFGVIATLSLDGIVVRELVNRCNPPGIVIGTAFRLRLIGSLLAAALSVGSVGATGADGMTILLVGTGSLVYVAQGYYVIDWHFQSVTNNRPSVLALNSAFLITSIARIIFILAHFTVLAFALANVLEAALASLLLLFAYSRNSTQRSKWSFDWVVARRLLGESWPLMLSGLAFLIYVRVDQVMIEHFLGHADVGIYAAAIRISEAWNFVPTIIVTAAFPRLLLLRQQDMLAYRAAMQRLFDFLAVIAIVAAIGTELFGGRMILFLYGAAYAPAGAVLKLSVWSAVFTSLGYASGRWLIAENLVHFALMRNVIGMIINIGANLYLIPHFGIRGAAVGTLLSYIFANLLSYATNRRLYPLFSLNLRALLLLGLLRPRNATS